MAFYLSPQVAVNEIDLSTTIPAVATSIGVLVLRQTFKGAENEQTLVTTDEQLKEAFGFPTTNSYKDLLAGMGYLKYGNKLYCTRVMPDDATLSGTKALSGYSATSTAHDDAYTFGATGSVDSSEDDGPYDYQSLGATDLLLYADQVRSTMGTNEPLWFTSRSRGQWGNNIRLLIYNQELYNSIRYYDTTNSAMDLPTGVTITAAASAAAIAMYDDTYTTSLESFNKILDLNTPLTSAYQLGIIIQAKDQGTSTWVDKEIFVVSTDENEINDEGESMFIETVLNEQSDYVYVALNTNYTTDSENDRNDRAFSTTDYITLTGGENGVFGRDDDVDEQDAEDSLVITAYELYDNPEEIDVNLFIDADKGITVKQKLIEICQDTRKDSFALLDVDRGDVVNNTGSEATDIVKWRKGQGTSTFNPNTSYAALYGNWLEVFDKWNKVYRWIPASGHMAGVYAHTDDVNDAWWAPAGLNRTILTSVRRLAWNPSLGERDTLYQAGVNPIVSFAGQGKVVWGQKTLLDKSSAFNRINVRRLFLVLEKSISTVSKYYLFEQNDEVTWMLMTNMIEPFLRDIKGRRGIYDFMVQINEDTNTAERIDRNELWGNIFIKPTRAAEFIVLNFIATKTGADFNELAQALNP